MWPSIDTQTPVIRVTESRKNFGDVGPNESGDLRGTTLLLTVEEAGKLLRLGRTTAYELVMRGTIPSVKIGRRRLVVRSGLEDFVAELAEAGEAGYRSDGPHSMSPIASAALTRSGSRRCP